MDFILQGERFPRSAVQGSLVQCRRNCPKQFEGTPLIAQSCVYKLRSHLAAPVNDDIPVTKLTLPRVQDGSCYSQFVLHHGKTIGFGILRLGRPGFEPQPCHSLDVWHWLGAYSPDGMMEMVHNNAFLKDH